MIRALSERERTFAWIAGFLLLVSVLSIFVIKPLIHENQRLSKEIHTEYRQLVLCQKVLPLRKSDIPETSASLLNQDAPHHDNVVTMLAEIELLAKRAGVVILDMRPQVSAQPVPLARTRFELRCEGSQAALIRYIHLLSGSPILFTINRLQISPKVRSSTLEAALGVTGVMLKE